VWSEHIADIGDPEFLTHHAGWALTARYAQHVSSLLQEAIATGAHQRLHLEDCAGQVKAKNRVGQGHLEGQPRASAEECPPGDAHQGAE
jgi:hypothetical protein